MCAPSPDVICSTAAWAHLFVFVLLRTLCLELCASNSVLPLRRAHAQVLGYGIVIHEPPLAGASSIYCPLHGQAYVFPVFLDAWMSFVVSFDVVLLLLVLMVSHRDFRLFLRPVNFGVRLIAPQTLVGKKQGWRETCIPSVLGQFDGYVGFDCYVLLWVHVA